MTDDAEQEEWITTREAADVLKLSHNQAFVILGENECKRRDVNPRFSEWRRADVLALAELRQGPMRPRRITDSDPAEEKYREPRGFAHSLAERIRDYWAERGYDVRAGVRVVNVGLIRRNVITSDLVNGLPRDWGEK